MKVKDIMTKKPVVAELPGSRDEVLKVMVTQCKTGLPVLKKKSKKLAGFVTRQDLFAKPDETQLALLIRKDYPTVKPDSDVKRAANILIERDLHHLPVVKDEKLVGVLTPADLLKIVEKRNIKDPVIDYVRTPCVPVYRDTPLNVALAVVRLARVYALPVMDDDAVLCGLVTDRDIFNLSDIDGTMAISDLGLGEDEDAWTWEGLRNVMKLYYEVSKIELPHTPVEKVMVKNPMTIYEKTPITEAAKTMRRNDYGQLPIVDSNDRLVAMIYELDAVAALFV